MNPGCIVLLLASPLNVNPSAISVSNVIFIMLVYQRAETHHDSIDISRRTSGLSSRQTGLYYRIRVSTTAGWTPIQQPTICLHWNHQMQLQCRQCCPGQLYLAPDYRACSLETSSHTEMSVPALLTVAYWLPAKIVSLISWVNAKMKKGREKERNNFLATCILLFT